MKNIPIIVTLLYLIVYLVNGQQVTQRVPTLPFPGVSRDLASFCAARPSLPIDLASMIVHVKKNTSFNYKLYLFSADHVFQTGQVIPRDDFRIHSFPVKLKRLNEFWPSNVNTYHYTGPTTESLKLVASNYFNLKQFLSLVPIEPKKVKKAKRKPRKLAAVDNLQGENQGDALPGDDSFISHDVARVMELRATSKDPLESDEHENYNSHIDFDRDDQLSISRRAAYSSSEYFSSPETYQYEQNTNNRSSAEFSRDSVLPVGSFSSFHVNLTYLVRKDFGQLEPQLIRAHVDANQFVVTQLIIINNGSQSISSYPQNEDYNFLSHKLLRDSNTRITAINQIYEDWITRNFYTVVYIQRRLGDETNQNKEQTIVNDRLVFRGTSIALLGADQLDYNVKAAAFITEKNGLHYYLEFLTTGKFYLCAVDWTKRPFKIIDSRKFPIKATRTQLDNEELLLCPPAICYSNQPVDEIVSYGRVSLPDKLVRDSQILSSSLNSPPINLKLKLEHSGTDPAAPLIALNETALVYTKHQRELAANRLKERQVVVSEETVLGNMSLDNLIEAVKMGSNQLQTRLHLRDWVWILPRRDNRRSMNSEFTNDNKQVDTLLPSFEWHYELARRNDIKVKPDTYGYLLTGHEIEASYRVYNELYLISVSSYQLLLLLPLHLIANGNN